MKYTTSIEINLPRSKVVELFDSHENLHHWQPGLISFEHLSGDPGQPGAKSRLLYKMGGRETEMIETITERQLPDKFHGTYEAKGVYNLQENYFEDIAADKTRWISHTEFRFNNLMMRIIGWLLPGAFKKQSLKFMKHFKQWAEEKA